MEIDQKIIGMSEKDAICELERNNFIARVMERDGQSFVGTCEFRPNRLNLSIKDGIVVSSNRG